MLKFDSLVFDDVNSKFILTTATDIPSFDYKVDGSTFVIATVGGVNILELPYTLNNKEILVNKTGETFILFRIILRKEVFESIDPVIINADSLDLLQRIIPYEVYLPCGETNILLADNYDRGLNDGLILGQMI